MVASQVRQSEERLWQDRQVSESGGLTCRGVVAVDARKAGEAGIADAAVGHAARARHAGIVRVDCVASVHAGRADSCRGAQQAR